MLQLSSLPAGHDELIYVKVPYYDLDGDSTGEYFSAVMVKSESDTSGDIKLNIKEPYDGARSCYNEVAAAEELLYLDSSSWQGAGDRIKVLDEEVLTFYLEMPPESGIYVESNSVMVDRAEVGVEWQSDYGTYDLVPVHYPTLNCADDFSEGFYDELGTANFVWWQQFNNGDLDSNKSHWDSIGDTAYADNVDFAVWCGHGTTESETPRALRFFVDWDVGMNRQPPDKLTWSEVDWGDQDVEWVVLNTCRFLRGNDTELKEMASGVHLICGYYTDMTIYCYAGEYFADRVDATSIKEAWWDQYDQYQEDSDENIARVFGATECMNEDISGSGPAEICRDPTSSSTYTHEDYDWND